MVFKAMQDLKENYMLSKLWVSGDGQGTASTEYAGRLDDAQLCRRGTPDLG